MKSLRERQISLNASNIKYFGHLIFKWSLRLWCHENILSMTLKRGIHKKRLDAALLVAS